MSEIHRLPLKVPSRMGPPPLFAISISSTLSKGCRPLASAFWSLSTFQEAEFQLMLSEIGYERAWVWGSGSSWRRRPEQQEKRCLGEEGACCEPPRTPCWVICRPGPTIPGPGAPFPHPRCSWMPLLGSSSLSSFIDTPTPSLLYSHQCTNMSSFENQIE